MAEERTAIFSMDDQYRYTLRIVWDARLALCQFVGLNPSTADEMKDDPTLRRVKEFARMWGYGGIIMTNIFAFRSTDPKPLYSMEKKAVGGYNDKWLVDTSTHCDRVIAAWGVHGQLIERGKQVAAMLGPKKLYCMGLTAEGFPKHPLYLKRELVPKPYWPF